MKLLFSTIEIYQDGKFSVKMFKPKISVKQMLPAEHSISGHEPCSFLKQTKLRGPITGLFL